MVFFFKMMLNDLVLTSCSSEITRINLCMWKSHITFVLFFLTQNHSALFQLGLCMIFLLKLFVLEKKKEEERGKKNSAKVGCAREEEEKREREKKKEFRWKRRRKEKKKSFAGEVVIVPEKKERGKKKSRANS